MYAPSLIFTSYKIVKVLKEKESQRKYFLKTVNYISEYASFVSKCTSHNSETQDIKEIIIKY